MWLRGALTGVVLVSEQASARRLFMMAVTLMLVAGGERGSAALSYSWGLVRSLGHNQAGKGGLAFRGRLLVLLTSEQVKQGNRPIGPKVKVQMRVIIRNSTNMVLWCRSFLDEQSRPLRLAERRTSCCLGECSIRVCFYPESTLI